MRYALLLTSVPFVSFSFFSRYISPPHSKEGKKNDVFKQKNSLAQPSHSTDTHIYVFPLALAFSINNKQQKIGFCWPGFEMRGQMRWPGLQNSENRCVALHVTKHDKWQSTPQGRVMREHYQLSVRMYTPRIRGFTTKNRYEIEQEDQRFFV